MRKSKGKLIYIGGFELPDKNAAAQRVLGNAKSFKDIGYDVVFIGTSKIVKKNTDIRDTLQIIEGFQTYSVPYPKNQLEWIDYLTNIEHIKKIVRTSTDVKAVITYNYPSISLIKLRSFCKKNNIKLIGDCTEWYSIKGLPIYNKIIKGIDSELRMRYAQKKMDGIIVISEYLKKYYESNTEVIKIPPLVDLNNEKWYPEILNRENEDTIITYSGSPGKNKDKLNKVIEALYLNDKVTDYKFNVVGLTIEEYLSYYPNDKYKLKTLANKVTFLGRQSHKDSLKLLKNSDFSVFIREKNRLTDAGFPTKFVESLSCGIPVITTKTSDLDGFLVDGFNGFFLEEDTKKLTDKFNKILLLPKIELKKIKENCSNYKKFHYKNYSENFEAFFDTIL